ncbi:MAG: hypothetical protein H6R10_319 [Rhodocyclaceae bacterium]|nr:hypothetical protein [Rhodocyclaceae bacterium]
MKILAFALTIFASAIVLADEQPVIGRLFGPAGGGTARAMETAQAGRVRVDGAVARSSHSNTVWVNGIPTTATGPGASFGTKVAVGALPAVNLHYPPSPRTGDKTAGETRTAVVRVGETLDLDNANRNDIVPKGTITIGRSP